MNKLTGYRVPSQSEHDTIRNSIYKKLKNRNTFCSILALVFLVQAVICFIAGETIGKEDYGILFGILLTIGSLILHIIDNNTDKDKILARNIKKKRYLILDCTVADFKQVNFSKNGMVGTKRYITIKDRDGRESQRLFQVDAITFADLHNNPDTQLTVITDEEQYSLIRI